MCPGFIKSRLQFEKEHPAICQPGQRIVACERLGLLLCSPGRFMRFLKGRYISPKPLECIGESADLIRPVGFRDGYIKISFRQPGKSFGNRCQWVTDVATRAE